MKILETVKTNSGTQIKISFAMKDSLRKAIPSAKWIASEKVWSVGPRCEKKLMAWIEEAKKQFKVEEFQSASDDYKNKLEGSGKLSGHTFDFKDELIEKFKSAFFGEKDGFKGWFVAIDELDAAQKWLNEKNKTRQEKHITEEKLTNLRESKSSVSKLNVLKEIINNIGNNYEYAYQDDYFYSHFLKYSDIEKEGKLINGIAVALSDYITFADENDNPGLFFSDSDENWLRIFGIPKAMIIDFSSSERNIIDFKTIEENLIYAKMARHEFKTFNLDEASKDLDDAKNPPVFKIKSEKTGVSIDITHKVEIERVQSSARVHYYEARNIPVLLDENYVTEVYYWRNRHRISEYTIKNMND